MNPTTISLALNSQEETEAFGALLAKEAKAGDTFLLEGDLGSGKTTLAQGFIRHLLGQDTEVNSPTFNLVHPYDSSKGKIYHFDLYRLEKAGDLVELGLEDALQSGICLIEWPALAKNMIPESHLHIVLRMERTGRKATITAYGNWQNRISEEWLKKSL